MRIPDDPDQPMSPPFGHPERRPSKPSMGPVPRRRRDDDLPPGIERGPDGRLRTTDKPKD